MFASNTSHSGEQLDAQFNYVTMLLPGNGTNGAQNNTFLDSSTNNFTITRNGNATQGSFSPYGSLWSNYFDGTGYLSVAANSALNQSGDLTIEGWVNLSATPSTIVPIYSFENANFLKVGFNSSRQVTVDQSQVGVKVTGTTAVSLGTWNHIALVRSGSSSNNCKIYLNGVLEGQFTDTSTCTVSGTGYIFRRSDNTTTVAGYLSNLRVTNTAVYTSAFTPSTTPLTAVPGTSLLTCQSNRFIDNSTNNFTITRNGDVSVQRFSPFHPTAPYAAGTIGGSGYFDGSGDYLALTQASLSTNDYTIECWIYATSDTPNGVVYDGNSSDLAGNGAMIVWKTGTINFRYIGNSTPVVTFSGAVPNTWYHVAISKSGTGSNNVSCYVNGIRVGQMTYTTSLSSTSASLGTYATRNNYYFPGYISNFRVLNGTALYSGTTITVPTAPLTAVTNTSLLLNFTNGGIIDNAMMNDLETVGDTKISTSVVKYGTGSMAFDGTGDWLALQASSQNFNFGSGDFTVELWYYPTSFANLQTLFATDGSNAGGLCFAVSTSGTPYFYLSAFYYVGPSNSVSLNTWQHLAYVRSNGSIRIYVNGVGGTAQTLTTSPSYATPRVGGNPSSSSENAVGYIDDLRITKGYARYTANFTPPTAAFPTN